MEHCMEKTIDELGRVVLPKALRQRLGWGAGDLLAFNCTKNSIIISVSKRHEGPRCIFCNRLEQKICVNGSDICNTCLQEIIAASAP